MTDTVDRYIRDLEYFRDQIIYQLLGPDKEYSLDLRNKIYRIKNLSMEFFEHNDKLELLREIKNIQDRKTEGLVKP